MRQTSKKAAAFLGLLLVLMQVTSVLGEAGFREQDGYTYCFDADGSPLKGWQALAGGTYYFDENGCMKTGWVREPDKLFYIDAAGKLVHTWTVSEPEDTWEMVQYSDQSGNNAMFYSLYNLNTEELILIDGGWHENTSQVRSVIESFGGKVKAWFLTHYHVDHATAFNELWPEYRDKIEKVYASPLVWEDFIEVAQYWDTPETFETFLANTKDAENIVYLNPDDELDVSGFHLKVLSSYDENSKAAGDIPNNCSLTLKLTTDSLTFLFCGDNHGQTRSEYLTEKYGDELRADVVQPGHHGNNSMTTDFFALAAPSIMTFDAPEWLMTGEQYTAKDLKKWCEERGILVLDYTTAPNLITNRGYIQPE